MGEADVVTPPGCSAHVRDYLVRVTDLFRTRDAETIGRELLTVDVEFIDERPLGAGVVSGITAASLWLRTMFEMIPDWQIEVEVLAQDGDVYLAVDRYSGEGAEGFGPTETEWFVVDVLRDGRLAREEIYADEQRARAAFDRLR